MLKRNILLSLLFITTISTAQVTSTSWWTWMKGDSTTNNVGIYGTQGNPSTNNKPGARRYSVSWKDNAGNLWMFGGQGYATTGGTGFLNDLWKYDPSTNLWTWMKGDNTAGIYATYGTQGIPSSTNKPGARYSSVSWTDASGNLWLFGGYGFASDGLGYLNDLWKYDPLVNQWSFIKCDSSINSIGVYGTQNTSSSINKPGARYGSISWTDASGNLWLFGGYGYAAGGSNDFNDLWRFNPSTNEWTWMKGNNTVNTPGAYGTKGVAAIANNPGARRYSTSWKDNAGDLYLFGGYGYAASGGVNFINDVWKYDMNANQWTWLNGDSTAGIAGEYGTSGSSSTSNKPGARYLSTSWKDANGSIWLFGGYGYAATDGGYLNDLWKYDANANEWTWVKGENNSNNVGVYGSEATTTSYTPGARQALVNWIDNSGNLWMFGGHGYTSNGSAGYLNDLWKFGGSVNILPLTMTSIKAYAQKDNAVIEWTSENEESIHKYEIERSENGTAFVKVGAVKSKSNIASKANYTWIDNAPFLSNNFYRIKTFANDGDIKYSKVVQVNFGNDQRSITVYPNPVINRTISIQLTNQPQGMYEVKLFNNLGQQVYKREIEHNGISSEYLIQLTNISKGIYQLQIRSTAGSTLKKIAVSR